MGNHISRHTQSTYQCKYSIAQIAVQKKSKTTGLTEAEKADQQALRREYIDDMKASLRAQLANTSIQEPDGTIHKVTRRADLENPRS